MTVREAIPLVNDEQNTSYTIRPHSHFLIAVSNAVNERMNPALRGQNADPARTKLQALADDLTRGARIYSISTVSDRRPGTHSLFECAENNLIFDPNSRLAPTSPIQLVVAITSSSGSSGTSVYCFQERDRPVGVERLGGTRAGGLVGMHRHYFSTRIRESPRYSRQEAGRILVRWVPADRAHIPDVEGRLRINEIVAFDFPALQLRMHEVGSMSITDALNLLKLKLAADADKLETFGLTLPLSAAALLASSSLFLLSICFILSVPANGRSSFPELIRDLPKLALCAMFLVVIILLPSLGLLLTAQRLTFVLPGMAALMLIFAALYFVTTCALTSVAFFRRRRMSVSAGTGGP